MANNYAKILTGNGHRKPRYEHVTIAEKALGKSLPPGAEVHHVNGIKNDNRPENLVICPDSSYHRLLHIRTKAIEAGYPAHYRTCRRCKQFDDPKNLNMYTAYGELGHRHKVFEHSECRAIAYQKLIQKQLATD